MHISPHTPALSFSLTADWLCNSLYICFPAPTLSHWESTIKYFFLRNILLYIRLALGRTACCSPTPRTSSDFYQRNLHTRTFNVAIFPPINKESLFKTEGLKALLVTNESFVSITILQAMPVQTKWTALTTISDLIFYMLWKKGLAQFLSFRKTDYDKLESLCVIHYWKLID